MLSVKVVLTTGFGKSSERELARLSTGSKVLELADVPTVIIGVRQP